MQYANLHLHSTYSDAGFTPSQLVKIGKALGYGALALTDHDTDGGCEVFMRACKSEGIRTVSGAEFYAAVGKRRMHLTALDFEQTNPGLREFIKKRCDVQADWARECVEKGLERGIIQGITWDDVLEYCPENAWICADVVFQVLRVKGTMPE